MFEKFVGRMRCRMGRHQRSRHKVKLIDGVYRSRCVHCDRPMREGGVDGWQLDTGQVPKNSGRLLNLD